MHAQTYSNATDTDASEVQAAVNSAFFSGPGIPDGDPYVQCLAGNTSMFFSAIEVRLHVHSLTPTQTTEAEAEAGRIGATNNTFDASHEQSQTNLKGSEYPQLRGAWDFGQRPKSVQCLADITCVFGGCRCNCIIHNRAQYPPKRECAQTSRRNPNNKKFLCFGSLFPPPRLGTTACVCATAGVGAFLFFTTPLFFTVPLFLYVAFRPITPYSLLSTPRSGVLLCAAQGFLRHCGSINLHIKQNSS